MNKPVFNEKYSIWIPGEPVAKSTQRPPRGKSAYWVVQHDDKYRRLRLTWAYQKSVAEYAVVAGCPVFDKDDPIRLSAQIIKSGHKTGDTKNVIACVEDGLQLNVIPNDRQITSYGLIEVFFNAGTSKAGVKVWVGIDPRAKDICWLAGWLRSERRAKKYQLEHRVLWKLVDRNGKRLL